MDTNRHTGNVAIVTGAGSGIGAATATRLAAEGATVICVDIAAQAVADVASGINESGGSARAVAGDITQAADIEAILDAAGAKVDVLANVAGIMDHFAPLGELDDELWERVIDVNLNGVMRLTRAVIPLMEAAGSGSIVTVGSKASASAGASGVAYATSKHAIVGLNKHVAYYYGPKGIRSNIVLPGAVMTNIAASAEPRSAWAMERAQLSMATMPAPAEPDQIATAVSWLASAEASNINGAILAADGGWSTA